MEAEAVQWSIVRGEGGGVGRVTCDPLVLGPALAMLRRPGVSCLRVKFSSLNLSP